MSKQLQEANQRIRVVKEQAEAGNPTALASDLARLRAVKARYAPEIAPLCDEYLAEKAAKAAIEERRDQTKDALNAHRGTAFPGYETAINLYLGRFNAGFRLGGVTYADTRGMPVCNYNLVVRNTTVAVSGSPATPGQPSFRNTLSSGDRNTLALAFFFASLDHNPGLGDMIVVIDDPNSSHDDHRTLTTVQQIRELVDGTRQVIVLSHNKRFLCELWERADRVERQALEVVRDGDGSIIRAWDVNQDSITEHDRRHARLRAHLEGNAGNNRAVAEAIRPVLEGFLRVLYPQWFPPGTTLGPFIDSCRQKVGTTEEVLGEPIITELDNLRVYANRFHHDTNPAWQTEHINDGELRGYVERTLNFTRR